MTEANVEEALNTLRADLEAKITAQDERFTQATLTHAAEVAAMWGEVQAHLQVTEEMRKERDAALKNEKLPPGVCHEHRSLRANYCPFCKLDDLRNASKEEIREETVAAARSQMADTLRKYGGHAENCAKHLAVTFVAKQEATCNCGWAEMLEGLGT